MGDRDVDYLDQYRIALLDGHGVIAVVSNNAQTRSEVRQILKKAWVPRRHVLWSIHG
jgi:hypothetical protein